MKASEKGSLFVVSTPIGNLGDITFRSVEKLQEVQLIAAEDTRRTRVLLNHYNIKTPLSSYNSYNQERKGKSFIKLLNEGKDIALVSDAGTPGISDPLFHLVQSALAESVSVYPLPGPSAVLAALVTAGLPMDRFMFEGFLPRKKRRAKKLEALAALDATVILYESPHRVEKTLADLLKYFGNRKVSIARELTKIHEEVLRGDLQELISATQGKKWKGEVTLLIAGNSNKQKGN